MKINHGANLYDLSKSLGVDKKSFLDFSSNINPLGASSLAKEYIINNIDSISIYPDPSYSNLKSSISQYCKCNLENIILGNGATELISSFIKYLNPKKSLLLSPVYSEFEKELNKINSSITKYFHVKNNNFQIDVDDLIDSINSNFYDLVVICNPNNPTGFAFSKSQIEKILSSTNTFLMIDETYIEFTDLDTYSSSSLVNSYDNLFVIRGTSKFFSTPGIRLGYGLISNKSILNNMAQSMDLWNINIVATLMGEIMFLDKDFINNSYDYISKEREFLLSKLNTFDDFNIYNSSGNFILCEIKSKRFTADDLRMFLLNKNIIIRDCSSFEGLDKYFFRICILSNSSNKYLLDCLSLFIDKK